MSINIHDNPPTELEALRPNKPCSNADLVRFLNFTDALGKWYQFLYNYEHGGPQKPIACYQTEVFLREATWALFERFYVYFEAAPKGKHWHPDRAFMDLFPKTFPPLFDGTRFTWPKLVDKIVKVLQKNLAGTPPEKPKEKAPPTEAPVAPPPPPMANPMDEEPEYEQPPLFHVTAAR